MHGTTRALIANMEQGILKGYSKELAIYGTGYGVKEQQNELLLTLGFAHTFVIAEDPNMSSALLIFDDATP